MSQQSRKDSEAKKTAYKAFARNEGGRDYLKFLSMEEAEYYRQMFEAKTQEEKASAVDKMAALVRARDKFLSMAGMLQESSDGTQ